MNLRIIHLRASTIRAILCYCDPIGGPRIAADDDDLADALCDRLIGFVGNRNGSYPVSITFGTDDFESGIVAQFDKVLKNILFIFKQLNQE